MAGKIVAIAHGVVLTAVLITHGLARALGPTHRVVAVVIVGRNTRTDGRQPPLAVRSATVARIVHVAD